MIPERFARWFKRIAIGTGILCGLLLSVLIGILFYLQTDRAQAMVQQRINAVLPGRLSWDRLNFSLFAGTLDLKGVLLQGPDNETLARLERLTIDIAWARLLTGDLAISSARLTSPRVNLALNERGTLNLMSAFPASTAPSQTTQPSAGTLPVNITVGTLHVTDGSLRYRSSGAEMTAEVSAVDLSIERFNLAKLSGTFALEIGKGSLQSPQITSRLKRFNIHTALKEKILDPLSIQIETDGITIDVNGHVDDVLTEPVLALTLDAGISLAEIRTLFQLTPALSGAVAVQMTAAGNPTNPEATLAIQYNGGDILGQRVDKLDLGLNLRDRLVEISHCEALSPIAALAISGQADLKKAFPRGFLNNQRHLEALAYRLTLKQTQASLDQWAPKQEGFGGEIATTLAIEGKGISPETVTADLALSLQGQKVTVPGIAKPLDLHLAVAAGIAGTKATIKSLTARAEGLTLTGEGEIDLHSQTLAARVGLKIPNLAAPLDLVGVNGITGDMDLAARVSGSIDQPEVAVTLNGTRLAVQGITLGDLQLNASLDRMGGAIIEALRLKNQGSLIEASGKISVFKEKFALHPDLPVDITLALRNVAPSDFFPKANLQGAFNGALDLKGAVMAPRARLTLQGSALTVGPTVIGDVSADLGLADGTLTLETLTLTHKQSKLFARGTARVLGERLTPISDPAFQVNLTAEPIHLNDFTDTLGGKMHLAATAKGPLSDIQADITLQGEGLSSGTTTIGDLDAHLRFAQGVVFLDPVKLRNRRSGLDVTGTATVVNPVTRAFLQEPGLDLRLSGDSLYLDDFFKDLKGRLVLNGRIKGSPQTPEGAVTIEGRDLDLGVQALKEVSLAARLDGQKVHIEKLKVALSPQAILSGSGWVSLANATFEARVATKNFPLDAIDTVRAQEMGDGKLALDLSGSGTLKNPRARGTLEITQLRVNQKPMGDIRLRLNLADQLARVEGNLGFDLAGQYHLLDKAFSADIRFDGSDLTPYFKMAGQKDFSGRINGTVRAEGDLDTPEKIKAAVDLSRLTILFKNKELLSAPKARIVYENQTYAVSELNIHLLEQGRIKVDGRGSLNGNLALQVSGNIPLKVIEPFLADPPQAKGTIKVSALLEGTLKRPVFRADVELDRLGMLVPGLGQSLRDINGRMRLTPDRVEIIDVKGMLDDGRFDVTGHADLDGFQPKKIDVALNAHQLVIEVPEVLRVALNGQLTASGTADKSNVSGAIVLLEGRYYKDVELNLLDAAKKKRDLVPVQEKSTPSLLDNMTVNVDISRREPFMVDNNLAFLSISPTLKVHGTAATPLMSGRAQVDSGIITFQKKEFKVQKGVIDFLNPYKIEPTVDIQAEMVFRTWTISLSVSGTPDNLDFKLTSTPPEQPADILSLLVFGKTTRELQGADSGSSFSPAQVLADFVAKTVQNSMKDATGLDSVEVKIGDQADKEDPDRVKVTVGKDLSRRISVKYGVDVRDGETIQRVTTDYKILENLLISGFQDTGGQFGGELKYRLEFR